MARPDGPGSCPSGQAASHLAGKAAAIPRAPSGHRQEVVAYLLDLASRIGRIAAIHGVDGYDVDQLREITSNVARGELG